MVIITLQQQHTKEAERDNQTAAAFEMSSIGGVAAHSVEPATAHIPTSGAQVHSFDVIIGLTGE